MEAEITNLINNYLYEYLYERSQDESIDSKISYTIKICFYLYLLMPIIGCACNLIGRVSSKSSFSFQLKISPIMDPPVYKPNQLEGIPTDLFPKIFEWVGWKGWKRFATTSRNYKELTHTPAILSQMFSIPIPLKNADLGMEKILKKIKSVNLKNKCTHSFLREFHIKGVKYSIDLFSDQVNPRLKKLIDENPNIEHLSFENWRLKALDFEYISEHLKNVKSLEIYDEDSFTDECLFHIKNLKHLESLKFNGLHITDKGVSYLKELTHLKFLCVTNGHNITNEGIDHLKNIAFQKLELIGCQITSLQFLEKNSSLLSLSLILCRKLNGDQLYFLKQSKNLKSLELREINITDESLSHLSHHFYLEKLGLYGTKITGKGLIHLKCPQLKVLDLSTTKINDDALEIVSKFKQLENLNLACCWQISDKGLLILSQGTCTGLKQLDISRCDRITDDGMCCLSAFCRLVNLSLMFSKITDKGIEKLTKSSNLEILNLSYCYALSYKCIDDLRKFDHLKQINLFKATIDLSILIELALSGSRIKVVIFHGCEKVYSDRVSPIRSRRWARK